MRRVLSLALFGAALWVAQPSFGQPDRPRGPRAGGDDAKKTDEAKTIEADLARLKEQVRELEAKIAKSKEQPKADTSAPSRSRVPAPETPPQNPPATDRRPIPPAAEEGNRERGPGRPGPGGPGGFGPGRGPGGPGGFGPPGRGPGGPGGPGRGPGDFGPPGRGPGAPGGFTPPLARGSERPRSEPSATESAEALTRRIDRVIGELEQLKKDVERLKK